MYLKVESRFCLSNDYFKEIGFEPNYYLTKSIVESIEN